MDTNDIVAIVQMGTERGIKVEISDALDTRSSVTKCTIADSTSAALTRPGLIPLQIDQLLASSLGLHFIESQRWVPREELLHHILSSSEPRASHPFLTLAHNSDP